MKHQITTCFLLPISNWKEEGKNQRTLSCRSERAFTFLPHLVWPPPPTIITARRCSSGATFRSKTHYCLHFGFNLHSAHSSHFPTGNARFPELISEVFFWNYGDMKIVIMKSEQNFINS